LAEAFPEYSRSALQRAFAAGRVRRNGEPLGQDHRIEGGDRITFSLPETRPSELIPLAIPLDVLYEDRHLLAVNKPSGMVVHPGAGTGGATLVHALLAQYHRLHGELLEMFRKEWDRTLAKLRVPLGYRLELDRILIERSLRMYALSAPEHPGWEQHMEENFQLPIASSEAGPIEVRGRIDRYEVAPNKDCVVYDYKFSRPSSVGGIVKDEAMGRGLQAGIYLQAVRRKSLRPLAFHYVAVKSACEMKGWDSREDLDALMTSAGEQAARAADEILSGRIAVAPIDEDSCAFCSFVDACRIREIGYGANAANEAAGANE